MGFLDGIVVLDLSTVGPAARASRWLADYGADVVKVGAPEGVQIQPPFYAYSAHRGMRRIGVDLKTDDGREEFLGVADGADVIIESFRPGVVDRLGIGYDAVKARNPRIVYCSTTGYGQDGPRAQWAGHDLNYLAIGGFLDVCGRGPDMRPPIPGATVADSAAGGMHAVMSILAALVARASTGEGAYLDVSVADGVLALMALAVDEFLAVGTVPGPAHGILTGRYACYDTYGCSDGKWLTVAAIEPRFWANLCTLLGLEQWIDHQTDDSVQSEIRADLLKLFRTRPRDEWIAELAAADTCVAPVLSVPEVVHDEQYDARGAFVDATDPEHGTFKQVGYVLAGSGDNL
ncbi:MAG: CoA transferase [Actinobacteria bacterium]|nr:CoA transferase [Actinomycetota bacterium]MBV8959003.1 CoA transferase [Actinomycetota bacterium]MBV9665710.1 CoA transferase [Actinomycetota bacterium]MBV9936053.1 CoA transferase [Actinomycetota bacterium]